MKRKRTHAQIGKGSKEKGAGYERKIAKILNDYMTCLGWGEASRTPRSGGWAKASNDPELRKLRGDITLPGACPFMVETKKREGWSLDQVFRAGLETWEPYKWFVEGAAKAKHAEKLPVLVFSRNHVPDLVMISGEDAPALVGAVPKDAVSVGGMLILLLDTFLEAFAAQVVNAQSS